MNKEYIISKNTHPYEGGKQSAQWKRHCEEERRLSAGGGKQSANLYQIASLRFTPLAMTLGKECLLSTRNDVKKERLLSTRNDVRQRTVLIITLDHENLLHLFHDYTKEHRIVHRNDKLYQFRNYMPQ